MTMTRTYRRWIGLAGAAITGLCAPGSFAADAGPAFYQDILPILQKHCLSCHHKGGSAPQSMETYAEMKPWIRSSKKAIAEKTMPPWHADPAVGKWANSSELTEAEIKTFNDWVAAKAPEGDVKKAPPAIDFAKPWKLGEPAKVLSMAEEFEVPAQGGDLHRAFVLGEPAASDLWATGIEFQPGSYDAVYHLSLSIVPGGAAEKADATDAGPGFKAFDGTGLEGSIDYAAAWNKGMTLIRSFPGKSALLIPKGSTLVLVAHYKTFGEVVKDKSSVGLHLAKSKPAKEVKVASAFASALEIPANAAAHKVEAEVKLAKGGKIFDILPVTHYLGKKIEVLAEASGKSTPLLTVTDYSYDLQTAYAPAEPVALAAGTVVKTAATYDNTKDNTNNPNMAVQKASRGPAPGGEVLRTVIRYVEE